MRATTIAEVLKLADEFEANEDRESVNYESLKLAQAVCKKIGAKYQSKNGGGSEYYIYREQEPYALGYVAYKNYSYTGEKKKMYTVFSRKIHNGKYGHSDRMYSASTTNFDKAVKNACRYLVPYSVEDIVYETFNDARRKFATIKETRHEASTKSRDKIARDFISNDGVENKSPLEIELRNLLQTDYEFVDKEFKLNLVTMFEELDDYRNRKRERHLADVVYVTQTRSGDNKFGVISQVTVDKYYWDGANCTWYTSEDLPQHLAEGIAKLNILPQGQFCDGVGFRPEDVSNIYYVYSVS